MDVPVTSVGWLVVLARSLIVGFLVDDGLVARRCYAVPPLVTSVAELLQRLLLLLWLLLLLRWLWLRLLLLLLGMMVKMTVAAVYVMEVMGSVVVVGTAVAAADLAIRHR